MKSIAVGHQDQITSVAYDFYGRRMATCSADHTIKVFDKVNGNWQLNDSWRAHEAPVIKISWAGPKHTPILASGSHDCTVKLWEEFPEAEIQSGRRWRRRHTISDFKGPLYDVEFSPSTTSLKLAAIASDGILRIYEAIDSSNLGFWTSVFEEPLLNRPVSRQLQSSFALSWAPTPSYSDWIAVAVLDDALLFTHNAETGKYVRMAELAGHNGLIRDIAWAPVFGRSHALVATACKDGNVRIFQVTREPGPQLEKDQSQAPAFQLTPTQTEDTRYTTVMVHESDLHNGEVWRVTWNSSGTILASTGDDAQVRFWKSMFMGSFKCMATFKGN